MSDYCSPNASICLEPLSKAHHGCKVSCTGLYADVQYTADAPKEMTEEENTRTSLTLIAGLLGNFP